MKTLYTQVTTLHLILCLMSLTIWSYTMLYFYVKLFIYHIKVLMFYNVQISNLNFLEEN